MHSHPTTGDGVKHDCDIAGKVKRHPWLFVAAALVIGYFWGWLWRKKHAETHAAEPDAMQTVETVASPNANQAAGSTVETAAAPPSEKPAATVRRDASASELHNKMRELKSVAIGAGIGALREMVVKRVVPDMQAYIVEVMNTLTTRMGGEVIPRPTAAAKPTTDGAATNTAAGADTAGGKSEM